MKTIPNSLFFSGVEAEIAEGRPVRFRLKGWSMFPLLRNGKDEVVLYPCTEKELHPMDVVLFRYNGQHVLHRILKREGNQLYLRGDGSFVAREACTVNEVVGKVRFIIRPSGRIVAVQSRRWRWPGMLWNHTGIFRTPLLRVLRRLYCLIS